jgi:hypothetical protein
MPYGIFYYDIEALPAAWLYWDWLPKPCELWVPPEVL